MSRRSPGISRERSQPTPSRAISESSMSFRTQRPGKWPSPSCGRTGWMPPRGTDGRRRREERNEVCMHAIPLALGIGLLFAVSTPPVLTAQDSANKSRPAAARSVSVLHTEHFSPTVADLDRSTAFYRDVIGLEIEPGRGTTWDSAPWLRRLHGTPDAPMRYAVAKVAG